MVLSKEIYVKLSDNNVEGWGLTTHEVAQTHSQ